MNINEYGATERVHKRGTIIIKFNRLLDLNIRRHFFFHRINWSAAAIKLNDERRSKFSDFSQPLSNLIQYSIVESGRGFSHKRTEKSLKVFCSPNDYKDLIFLFCYAGVTLNVKGNPLEENHELCRRKFNSLIKLLIKKAQRKAEKMNLSPLIPQSHFQNSRKSWRKYAFSDVWMLDLLMWFHKLAAVSRIIYVIYFSSLGIENFIFSTIPQHKNFCNSSWLIKYH